MRDDVHRAQSAEAGESIGHLPHRIADRVEHDRLHPGAQTAQQWVLPSGGFFASSRLLVFNPGTARADLSLVSQGPNAQQLVSGPNGVSVPPQTAVSIPVGGLANAALDVTTTNRESVVAVLELTGPGGDSATLEGAPAPAAAWVVLPSLPPVLGRTYLVVENPGRVAAKVSLTPIGNGGAVATGVPATITIAPGRTRSVSLFAHTPAGPDKCAQ